MLILFVSIEGTGDSSLIQCLFCGIQDGANEILENSTSGGGGLFSLSNGKSAILSYR
jgi:hypothetical protein